MKFPAKVFSQTQLGKYLLGMHTEMDCRLSAPAIVEIFNPGAGHACYLEAPVIFDEIVLRFLKKPKFLRL